MAGLNSTAFRREEKQAAGTAVVQGAWTPLAQPRDPGARGALPGGPPWGPPPGAQMRVFWAQNLVPTSPADSRQNSEFSVHFSWGFAGSEQNYLFIKIPARPRFQGYFRPFSGPRCTEKRLFLGVFGGVFHPPAAPEKRGFSAPPGGGGFAPPRPVARGSLPCATTGRNSLPSRRTLTNQL